MFTRKDIHPDIDLVLAAIARELKMYDNLAPDEINELTGISTHPTFIELNRRHIMLQARAMGHQYPAMTYYQMLRPTVVTQIVDMERHLARSRNPWAPHPITERERLYASRWLEIFEQSTQGKNTNGKQR